MSAITLESLAEAFAKKDAEIERLKTVIESQNRSIDRHLGLITELCDEVEWIAGKARGIGPNRDLLRRGREATK